MDLDKASADLERLFRSLFDDLIDKIKATHRKDTVLEGYRQRLAEYEKQKSRNTFEPSVIEACERHKTHYKAEDEKIKKELAAANAAIDKTLRNFAQLLVKVLPINGIKERQLTEAVIEAVKRDLDDSSRKPAQDVPNPQLEKLLDTLMKDHATTVTKLEEARTQIESRATNDRTQKLEEQMASLLKSFETQQAASDKSFKAQQAILDKLQQENADLQAQTAAFKAQQDQLQVQLDAKILQDSQIEAWKEERESLKSDITALQTQVNNLIKDVASQNADFPAYLQEAKTEVAKSLQDAAAKTNSTAQSIPLQEFRALEAQVKQLDENLSHIDAEEYESTVNKLLHYPHWTELNSRIQAFQGQSTELSRIGLETKGLTSKVKKEAAAVSARFTALDDKLRQFSDNIIQKCHEPVQRLESSVGELITRMGTLETRLTSIETRPVAASRAPSAVATASPRPTNLALHGNSPALELGAIPTEAPATDVQELRGELEVIRKLVAELKQEMQDSYSALDMMIMGLDEQFKNMTTVELASIILENLKKLPTNVPPLDIQNFHERLADLESFRQESFQKEGIKCSSTMKSLAKDITKFTETTKEGLAKRKRDGQEGEMGLN